MNNYRRISFYEREEVSRNIVGLSSYREIGRILKRHPSTICREIRRNGSGRDSYRALFAQNSAQSRACACRRKRKLDTNAVLQELVIEYLKLRWSPEQIAKRLKILYPNDTNMHISHESIYAYVYVHPKKHLKRRLLVYLRRKHKNRRLRNKTREKSSPIQDYISIDDRPIEVADRKIAGHWEGDLIMGAGNASAIGTLVERKTRMTLLVKLPKKDAATVADAFADKFNNLPDVIKKSLTYDQGQEMADHASFTEQTKIKVYFAHPHSPWERGTSENTNALVRDFFPSGTDFSKVSSAKLNKVQDMLNDRPRKVLNFYTPKEVFTKTVALGA
jgi:transposase, IS30 family